MFMALLRGRLDLTSWPCAKCETDLPESLRLGRVQVSCEGWSGPGDSYVLRGKTKTTSVPLALSTLSSSFLILGSCSLEYRLQEVPNAFNPSASHLKPPALLSTCKPDICTSPNDAD